MNPTLAAEAAQVRRSGEMLSDAGARLPGLDPGALAFGADAPGRVGQLAAQLRRHLQTALDARGDEAAAHAARLEDLADRLARAASGYAEIDQAADQRGSAVA